MSAPVTMLPAVAPTAPSALPIDTPAAVVPPREQKVTARARRRADARARTQAAAGNGVGNTDAAVSMSDASSAVHPAPPDASICSYYISGKRRLCSFPVLRPGARFCINHNTADADGTTRVLCPHCRTSIRAAFKQHADPARATTQTGPSPLDKHLLVCPKRRTELAEAQLPFYDKACNGVWTTAQTTAGANGTEEQQGAPDDDGETPTAEHAGAAAAASSLHEVPREHMSALIERLRAIAGQLGITEEMMDQGPMNDNTPHDTTEADAAAAEAAAASSPTPDPASLSRASRFRHSLQHVSFFAVLRRFGLLRESGSLLVEVGAGKAGLAGHIALQYTSEGESNKRAKTEASTDAAHVHAEAVPDNTAAAGDSSLQTSPPSPPPYTLVVLDRGSFKHKSDTHIRKSSRCALVRYRCDLGDVRLERMEEVQQAWVQRQQQQQQPPCATSTSPLALVIGKHVCGQATDFMVRAIVRANAAAMAASSSEGVTAATAAAAVPLPISGVAIATCCHHACSYVNYSNPEFIHELGLTPADFRIMARMSSWFTTGLQAAQGAGPSAPTPASVPASASASASASAPASASASTPASASASSLSNAAATSPAGPAPAPAAASPPFAALDRSHPCFTLTPAARVWLGFICKHVLDEGRVRMLRAAAGFRQVAARMPYTSTTITRENFVIIAA